MTSENTMRDIIEATHALYCQVHNLPKVDVSKNPAYHRYYYHYRNMDYSHEKAKRKAERMTE